MMKSKLTALEILTTLGLDLKALNEKQQRELVDLMVEMSTDEGVGDFLELIKSLVDAGVSTVEICKTIMPSPVIRPPSQVIRRIRKRKPWLPTDPSPLIVDLNESDCEGRPRVENRRKLQRLEENMARLQQMIATRESTMQTQQPESSLRQSPVEFELSPSAPPSLAPEVASSGNDEASSADDGDIEDDNIENIIGAASQLKSLNSAIEANMLEMTRIRSRLAELESDTRELYSAKIQAQIELDTDKGRRQKLPKHNQKRKTLVGRPHRVASSAPDLTKQIHVQKLLQNFNARILLQKRILESNHQVEFEKRITALVGLYIEKLQAPIGYEVAGTMVNTVFKSGVTRSQLRGPYISVLQCFRSRKLLSRELLHSPTFSPHINSQVLLCRYELQEGSQCSDADCKCSHFRDFSAESEEFLVSDCLSLLAGAALKPWNLNASDKVLAQLQSIRNRIAGASPSVLLDLIVAARRSISDGSHCLVGAQFVLSSL